MKPALFNCETILEENFVNLISKTTKQKRFCLAVFNENKQYLASYSAHRSTQPHQKSEEGLR